MTTDHPRWLHVLTLKLMLSLSLGAGGLIACGEGGGGDGANHAASSGAGGDGSTSQGGAAADAPAASPAANDPLHPASAGQATSTPAAADPLSDWPTYRHAQGASFRYPPGWQAIDTANGIALLPADPVPGQEIILITAAVLRGQSDPASAQVVAQMDQLIGSLVPALRRTQSPEPVATSHGRAALYRYQGTAANNKPVRGMVYLAIKDELALGLTFITQQQDLDDRLNDLQAIFSTLSMQAGTQTATQTSPPPSGQAAADTDDPRLIGRFRGEVLNSNTDIYINTQLVYIFNPDGSFYSGATSHFNGDQRDHRGQVVWSINESTDTSVMKGRWSSRNGIVTITWEQGGQSVIAYNFEPDGTLAARDPSSGKLINIYSRM